MAARTLGLTLHSVRYSATASSCAWYSLSLKWKLCCSKNFHMICRYILQEGHNNQGADIPLSSAFRWCIQQFMLSAGTQTNDVQDLQRQGPNPASGYLPAAAFVKPSIIRATPFFHNEVPKLLTRYTWCFKNPAAVPNQPIGLFLDWSILRVAPASSLVGAHQANCCIASYREAPPELLTCSLQVIKVSRPIVSRSCKAQL